MIKNKNKKLENDWVVDKKMVGFDHFISRFSFIFPPVLELKQKQ